MEMLKEELEGNWPGVTATVLISPVLEARSYHVGIAWRWADCTAPTLEEKRGLRSMCGGSAVFAV